jgi:hypothetical protein
MTTIEVVSFVAALGVMWALLAHFQLALSPLTVQAGIDYVMQSDPGLSPSDTAYYMHPSDTAFYIAITPVPVAFCVTFFMIRGLLTRCSEDRARTAPKS